MLLHGWHYFILFYGWVVFHCIYVPCLLYPFICRWTFRLFLCLGWLLWIVEPALLTIALSSAILYIKFSPSDLQLNKLGPGGVLCLLSQWPRQDWNLPFLTPCLLLHLFPCLGLPGLRESQRVTGNRSSWEHETLVPTQGSPTWGPLTTPKRPKEPKFPGARPAASEAAVSFRDWIQIQVCFLLAFHPWAHLTEPVFLSVK